MLGHGSRPTQSETAAATVNWTWVNFIVPYKEEKKGGGRPHVPHTHTLSQSLSCF